MGQPLVPLDRNTGFRVYGTWIFWRFLAEYFGGAIPANGIVRATWNRADGSPGGPDRYSTQAAAQAIAARTVNGTPWKLRWAFADFGVWNSRPARFYDEGASYPRPVAEQDPHEGHAVVRLEHDARPPHEPFGRDPSRFEPIGHRQAQDRRGRSWVRHGTGGEPPRDPKTGVSSVRSVILNSNGNGASRSPSVRRSRASSS